MVAAGLVLVAGGTALAPRRGATSVAPPANRASAAAALRPPVELVVPHAKGAIVLDGHLTDEAWLSLAVRTGPFVESDGRTAARPYSEARFLWGDGVLYVGLYASDEDIRATHEGHDSQVWRDDSFRLAFDDGAHEYLFDVSPIGALADGVKAVDRPGASFDYAWTSNARIAHDFEGSINRPDNNDEEWVIEMAIPIESLGRKGVKGERLALSLSRCDTPKAQPRSCSDWGRSNGRGVLLLD